MDESPATVGWAIGDLTRAGGGRKLRSTVRRACPIAAGGRATLCFLLALAFVALAAPALASAQTFTVTDLADSGAGSLRQAVSEANSAAGADQVVFAPGLAGRIVFEGVGIVISGPVAIVGPGASQLLIEQHAAHRVFELEPSSGAVTISGLHLAGGTAPSGGGHPETGGDLFNDGADLTLAEDVISGGKAADAGGIASYEGALTLRSSTVTGNHANNEGGLSVGGPGVDWTIVDSTIAGNTASVDVGGVGGETFGSGTIEDSTISGNTAEAEAGVSMEVAAAGAFVVRNSTIVGNRAVSNFGGGFDVTSEPGASMRIEDSTIAANYAADGGGGVSYGGPAGGLTLIDSIVSGNTTRPGAAPDIESFDEAPNVAFSLVGDSSGSKLAEPVPGSDLFGLDPQLGPLSDNGGPTQTMALAPSSPVLNKGGAATGSDQRGDPRPSIYPGVALSTAPGADGSDLGAYELQAPPVPPVAPTPPATSNTAGGAPGKKSPSPPRVKVSCPKSAAPGGCHLALQVVSGKPRRLRAKGKGGHPKSIAPTPESATATLKLAPGKSALVVLTPKPKFATRLDTATSLLLREAATIGGRRTVVYRRTSVVG
jgi:hypothetical protein